MAFQSTTGLGVAAKILVAGNDGKPNTKVPAVVHLSLSGASGYPTTFQLDPSLVDVANTPIAPSTTVLTLSAVAASTPGVITLTAVGVVDPGVLTLSAAATASGGTTVYTGTITGGGSNAFAGVLFSVAGFDTAANNGSFECTASSTTTLTLANAAGVADTHAATASSTTTTAVYTGTVTGGGSSAFEGFTFVVAGFDTAANNGTFQCSASTTTTLTLLNPNAVADTHAATATPTEGSAVYTGTITGGGSSAFAGETFLVAGFTGANNNGTFIATASTTTTLTLGNPVATAETHAATATDQEPGTPNLTYVVYGFKTLTGNTYIPSGTSTAVVTVSATGLLTAVAEGGAVAEISFPTFDNAGGNVVSTNNIMNGLPINKVYVEVNIHVVA